MSTLLIHLLKIYSWIASPVIHALCGPGCGCRFEPSCSVYAMEAIREHGSLRGVWLAMGRLVRCQPWGGCGYDPVPTAADVKFPWNKKQKCSCHNMENSNPGRPVC
ncbi:MAG: membrane protein insertion efficiency factor YidD [Terrimicrobiaceae bacterium]